MDPWHRPPATLTLRQTPPKEEDVTGGVAVVDAGKALELVQGHAASSVPLMLGNRLRCQHQGVLCGGGTGPSSNTAHGEMWTSKGPGGQ